MRIATKCNKKFHGEIGPEKKLTREGLAKYCIVVGRYLKFEGITSKRNPIT